MERLHGFCSTRPANGTTATPSGTKPIRITIRNRPKGNRSEIRN